MNLKPQGIFLVAVQLLAIGYLAFSGHLFAAPPLVFLELAGLALGTWAVLVVKPGRVNPLPEPRRDLRLVSHGPYRVIRHPMYAAVLLATLALLLDQVTTARLVVWLILLADLLAKLHYEEHLLARRFPDYRAYQRRTKRLIPFVY